MHPHSDFVHLHVHSEYSLLDGASRLEDLVKKAKEYHMPALAITDHGNMFGAIKFYQMAIKNGIKPIIGCELYVAPRSRFEKSAKLHEKPYYHFTVFARSLEGYRNLMRLSSYGYTEGYYYKPRVDMELLEKYNEGLLALSGCLRGRIPVMIQNNELAEAEELAKKFALLYGEENFYLELHDHGIPEQKIVNEGLTQIAKRTGLGLVASNDIHYTNREDYVAHDILLCIQTGNMRDDEKRLRFSSNEFYFKSPEEMKSIFSRYPGAISNTIKVAEKCNLDIDLETYHLPRYRLAKGTDPADYLYRHCLDGILPKYGAGRDKDPEIIARLEREFYVIKKMGFVDYFLITWDMIRYAKGQEIPVGPGRGSAAGSIIAYLLDITDIDPLKYDLLFERFLNEDRISMPDIDIDFCYVGRDKVIRYACEKYGHDCVAQIITFGTMGAKAAIRDVGRVLAVALSDVDKIAKMIPNELNISISDSIERVPELKELYVTNEIYRNLLDHAMNLEGLTRHASTHAAGVVISETPLTEHTPLFRSGEDVVTTQYDMGSVEKIGLLKMDFLGLKTLTVISDAVRIVKRTRGVDVDIARVALDDPKTFELMNEGRTSGVFQLESSGMRGLIRRMGVESFEEIIALIALYRPGPMNMLDDFIARKHKKVSIKYNTPMEEPILKNTYGIMLYQEQVMQMVNHIGKFTLAEADNFRRAISKKKGEIMDQSRTKFIEGAGENGVSQRVAEKIFNDILRFAGYGFNKSHSTAYAVISYRTAFLKANYTIEFMAALLDSELGNTDKIVAYIEECKDLRINILPPCINESYAKFTVVSVGIRFGLVAVKNVGQNAVESIISVRKEGGKFVSLFDFCERNNLRLVNKRVIESLVKCGAFDTISPKRAGLIAALDHALEAAQRIQREKKSGQISLFDAFDSQPGYELDIHQLPAVPEYSDGDKLAYEKEVLGFYVTGHPLARYGPILEMYDFMSSKNMNASIQVRQDVKTSGIITSLRIVSTRRNERMAFLTLEDLDGSYSVVIFPAVFERSRNIIKEDTALCIVGQTDIRNEEVQIIASDIFPLSDICSKYTKEVVLNIPREMTDEKLGQVKSLLALHKGHCPVIINIINGEHTIKLRASRDHFVFPNEKFLEQVSESLGRGAVRYVSSKT